MPAGQRCGGDGLCHAAEDLDGPDGGAPLECGPEEFQYRELCAPLTACTDGEYDSTAGPGLTDRVCTTLTRCGPGET